MQKTTDNILFDYGRGFAWVNRSALGDTKIIKTPPSIYNLQNMLINWYTLNTNAEKEVRKCSMNWNTYHVFFP